MRSGSSIAFVIWLLVVPVTPAQPATTAEEHFEKEVRPLLVAKCAACHGGERPKGGLKLTSRADLLKGGDSGAAVVPGKPDESLLLKAVRYHDEPRMPPKGKLTDRQIEALARWIKEGAPWPGTKETVAAKDGRFTITDAQRQFWSFRPLQIATLPTIRDDAWPKSSVDRFILSKLDANGLTPAAPADKRTLLRRATFDLIGLPPTPAEIDAFLADDSPQAFATGRRSTARIAALRRALGPALARRRALCRCPRPDPVAAGERLPRILALPRLGRRFVQSRSAIHGVHPQPGGRRPAAASHAQAASTRMASSPRACWPSPTSCPATSTRTR